MRFRVWLILAVASSLCPAEPAERWSQEKANAWYAEKPWLIGCNFGAILPYMKDNKFGAYNWGLVTMLWKVFVAY